ncbi:TRAP transporter small permease subunit [Marinimicrococcus flavescens]|uniref:TRAP transporter small permease protein n=1 Tax=Marinimicrococcus flavescens TaxID=3031815 RepID=A0AAP3XT11_9PROT|nr:TRAP transporter small permease subunit [Marinimicrococcus flavescens]
MIDRLNQFLGEKLAWLYLVAVVVTAYEVVMRYLFNAPTTWAFELTILLCAICYLLAGGFVTQQKAHIAITSAADMLPRRLRETLALVSHLIGIVAMVGLVWAAWKPAVQAVRIMERTGSAWNPPSPAIIKPLVAVSALLVLLQLVAHLVRDIRKLRD